MSNFTINPRRFQLLCAPLLIFLNAAIESHRSDWHTRKFSARHQLLLTLFAHFVHAPSANALLEELNHVVNSKQERNLRQMLGFDPLEAATDQPLLLNQSSFSRANANRRVPSGCGCGVTALVSYGKSPNLNANCVI